MGTESIEDLLADLRRKLDALPEAEEPPPTTLEVLGQSSNEDDWQQILIHFLTPDRAHGFDHAVLEHVLTALSDSDALGYSFSRFDLENVRIEQEVTTDDGIPDIVIWSSEDWFICFEVKIYASETNNQTRRYVDIEEFGGINLDKDEVPDDGHNYVYLAPEPSSSPSSDEFVEVSWEWLASELQTFLAESYGEYPARSTAQLDEFVDTVRSELTMTEYQENQQEKAELHVRYYDEIHEVEEAFDEGWEELKNKWGDQLIDNLGIKRVDSLPKVSDKYAIGAVQRGDDIEQWVLQQTKDDWSWMFKEKWWIDLDTGEYGPNRDARIGFLHRPDQHREEAIHDHKLKFKFRVAPPSDEDYRDAFNEMFDDREDEISELLPQPDEITGNKRNVLKATYDIDVDNHDNFFDAYVGALERAFVEHVVENEKLVAAIDDIHRKALQEVE